MDALQEARDYLEQYQNRINQDNFYGNLEERTRYEDCAYKEGMLSAAIAQADALRPRLVRIGDLVINLAQITYVKYAGKDLDDSPRVEICFAAANEYGSVFITFSGNRYEPVANFLRELLQPMLVAEMDPPQKVAP